MSKFTKVTLGQSCDRIIINPVGNWNCAVCEKECSNEKEFRFKMENVSTCNDCFGLNASYLQKVWMFTLVEDHYENIQQWVHYKDKCY
jgi:sugar (pentulose or hexulose) kinase